LEFNHIGGRDFRKQQRGDDDGADKGFRAVEGQIAGCADKGQKSSQNAFGGQLQHLDAGNGGGPRCRGRSVLSGSGRGGRAAISVPAGDQRSWFVAPFRQGGAFILGRLSSIRK
jgi:hypothetical protein